MHHDIAAWFLLHGNGTCNTLGRILCACACVCVCVCMCVMMMIALTTAACSYM